MSKKHKYRSGLELRNSKILEQSGADYEYEKHVLEYEKPATQHKYTPDFTLTKKDKSILYIETKGYMDLATRKKMVCVKQSNPDLDIRFVFQNSKCTISKKSKTTYGEWATKNGYPWAHCQIPLEWLDE